MTENELCEKLAIYICDISNSKEWDATLAEEHKERHRKVVREEILPIIRSYSNAKIEDLRQKNSALVSALRNLMLKVSDELTGPPKIVPKSHWAAEWDAAMVVLALYAPAEAEAKEKP